MTRCIHITPELPPAVGGVADYTALLSRRLVEGSDGTVEPVLVHAGKEPAEDIEVEFPVVDLSGQCSATALADTVQELAEEASEQAVVLLEYSGYGYAKRGAPLWLARGLSCAGSDEEVPLITMFHELYASGPPWTSAFWMSFAQAYVARRLAQLSEGSLTNRCSSETWLQSVSRNEATVKLQPVFSNVGEPDRVCSLAERESVAVVFGGTGKDALYEDHGDTIASCLKGLGISKVIDLGPPPSGTPIEDEAVHVDIRGFAEQETVSNWLERASIGILCRNPEALTKSGSLAAYMAHGVPSAVALRHGSASGSILKEDHHYVSLKALSKEAAGRNREICAAIGRQGYEWYMSNAHSRHAAQSVLGLMNDLQSV